MVSKYRPIIHPLSDMLPDGTEIRRVPDMKRTGNRPLYTTFDGAPYSHILQRDLVHGGYKSIYRLQVPAVDTCPRNRFNGNREQRYYKMRNHGNIYLHIAVALAWIGEQQTDEEGYLYQATTSTVSLLTTEPLTSSGSRVPTTRSTMINSDYSAISSVTSVSTIVPTLTAGMPCPITTSNPCSPSITAIPPST